MITANLPSGMVWHIFRKDLKLLWPLALAGTVTQALIAVIAHHSGPHTSDAVDGVAMLLTLGLAVTIVLVTVLAIQHEAIPGLKQDWLVRPIKRGDLLLAKLLCVALLVMTPTAAVNLLKGLSYGLPLGDTLRAVLLGTFEVAVLFNLPLMAIAALTKSLTEAIITALIVFLGLVLIRLLLLAMLMPFTHTFELIEPTGDSGIAWIWSSLSHVLLLAVMLAVLLLQYFRRDTGTARFVFVAGLCIFMLVPSLPWRPAFALQKLFAPHPHAGDSVAIAFDPALTATPTDSQLLAKEPDEKKQSGASPKDTTAVAIPMRFSGLPAALVLHADRTQIRLVNLNGRTVFSGTGHVFDFATGGDQHPLLQTFDVPNAIYHKFVGQDLRLEVVFSLTLLRAQRLQPVPAQNGEFDLPGIGHCTTGSDSPGKTVEIDCLTAGEFPPCVSTTLQLPTTGVHNPEKYTCRSRYEPAGLRFDMDPIDRTDITLPYRDSAGSVQDPINPTNLRDAQVVFTVYEPEDHFSRRLVVPRFRIGPAQAAPPSPH